MADWRRRPLQAEMQIGVILMMMMSARGEPSVCQVPEATTCSGQAGDPLYLQITNASGHQLELTYNTKTVFRYRLSKSVFYCEWNTSSVHQRWQFVPDNGTMIINPAERRDSGTYKVEIHTETGTSVGAHTVQLIIRDSGHVLTVLVPVVLILMCVCVAGGVFYFYKNKKNAHKPAPEEELHYAVVNVTSITQRRQKDIDELSGKPQESVYAQIQPGQ